MPDWLNIERYAEDTRTDDTPYGEGGPGSDSYFSFGI